MAEYEKQTEEAIDRIVREELASSLIPRYVHIGPENTCMPDVFVRFAESLKTFEIHDSDVVVATYPRSGTTWTQEMVWLISNNLDFEGAKVHLTNRFPFLEMCGILNFENRQHVAYQAPTEGYYDSIEYTKAMDHPRFIKTHLPFSLLPFDIQTGNKFPKIIYVIRNPKDACVSYYHFLKAVLSYTIDLENFCKLFLADKIMYGSYWKHVLGYWEHRNMANLLFIAYEDMIEDLPAVVRKVARFLDKAVPEDQLKRLCHHLAFESMKNNSAVNSKNTVRRWNPAAPQKESFMRSGIIGKHKEEISPETNEKFNAWIKENIEGTTLSKTYGYIF